MTFWILAALLLILTTAALLWPMLRKRDSARDAADFDMEVYRDQLRQIDRDHAEGLIGDRDAEAARAEIGRRLLAADGRRTQVSGDAARRPDRSAAVAVAILVPVCAVLLYTDIGAPGLPGFPFHERAAGGGDRTPELHVLAERLIKHLEGEPTDMRAWAMLGRTYTQLSEFGKAAQIYEKALILDGGNPELLSARGEALVLAAKGTVTADARKDFDAALKKAPENPRALFYLAIADEQEGKLRDALAKWKTLLAVSRPGAPWIAVALERGGKAAEALGLDPATALAPAPAEKGPTADDVAAAQSMTPDERQAMIDSMVRQLAARLAEKPEDPEGWLRLGRSYSVLGKHAEARDALAKAAELAPGNTDTLLLYGRAIRAAAGDTQTPDSVAVMRRVLTLDPKNIEALWLVGMAEAAGGDRAAGAAKMQQALDQLPADAPNRAALEQRLEELKGEK